MRRRRLSLCLAVLASLGLTGFYLLWLTTPGITRHNFNRIQAGMSEREVEALLGGRPGDYRPGDYRRWRTFNLWPGDRWGSGEPDMEHYWLGDDLFIYVFFDQDSRVSGACFLEVWYPEEPFLDKLRRLLPW